MANKNGMRYPNMLVWGVAAAAALFTGCAKKAAEGPEAPAKAAEGAALVATSERSSHFEAVNRQLELGGTLYGYVDIDGDMLKLADALHNIATQATVAQPMAAAFIPKDLAPFFVDLGLTDVKALGISSVAVAEGGFRNRVFFYTPEGRRGLLAGLGEAAGEFAVTKFAPADADLVYETELDAPATYAAIRAVVVRAAGEPMGAFLDAKLKTQDGEVPFSPMDMIEGAKGRFSLVLRIDDTRTFSPAPGFTAPAFDLAIRQERGGRRLLAAIEGIPSGRPMRREERAGGVIAFVPTEPLPFMEWTPELLIDGDALMLVTRPGFLATGGGALAADARFKAALARVGEQGNGLTYIGSRLAERMGRLNTLNPELPEEQRMVMQRLLSLLPQDATTLIAVRQNVADGVLFKSHWSASHKQSLIFANPGVVVGGGLMAAMAIPAFQKVRAASQQKAVLNNLRQLGAAADQYFLENGKRVCGYRDLVGTGPNHYIRELKPVAGEDYTTLLFRQGQPQITVTLKDGKTVTYDWNN